MKVIEGFNRNYSFLSNFYKHDICYRRIVYPSVEHAYQAQKILDEDLKRYIAKISSPSKAKKFVRTLSIRSDWEVIKEKVMEDLLTEKFKKADLRRKLLSTKDSKLVEMNWWHDNYWGDCRCSRCSKIEGMNKLGKILMKIREELKNSNNNI